VTFFQVALPELRELLERASAGEDDSVRVVGETTVAGRPAYEVRIDPADGASWMLYVDRENYFPVRFEIAEPSGDWATLDFSHVERVVSLKP
jgi:negative regulator of sigma E activity